MSYMVNTIEAMKANKQRLQKLQEERKGRVLQFIMNKQGETAYSIAKSLEIPRSTLIDLLDELNEDLQIKYINIKENGRSKKTIHTRTIDDFTHDRFNFISIDIPLIRRLIENTRKQKLTITFDMPDGTTKELLPSQNLEAFITRNS